MNQGTWVLLSYRVPREPSAPRIAIWRKLKQLGVAQLGDGLVALPADARTRERLEWVAQDVTEASGTAWVWLAQPTSRAQEQQLAASMAHARAAEYAALRDEATAAAALSGSPRASALRRLRAELRRINRRDYFPPAERDQAKTAIEALIEPAPVDDPAAEKISKEPA